MEADSTEDAPLPPPKIYLSSSLPGSSVPIRAPLTIDSDSELCLSNNDQIYSRTSSFNSTSSIDISSYGDEHTSVHEEEEDGTFLAYTDDEILIETCRVEEYSFTTPFVKHPNKNYVKERSNFDESAIFRSVVKTPCEESSSVADFRIKLGVPVAPLTSDCESDIDSMEGRRWLDSGEIPADGIAQKVTMSPQVRLFSGDEVDKESQFEGMFSNDSINSIHKLRPTMKDSVIAESIEDKGHEVDCLNVVESQKIDSDNEVEVETINDYIEESKKAPSEKEEETLLEIQPIKSKLLNLIRLLGLSNQDSTVIQFLHRLALENNKFDFNLTILVIGKTGVGKTSTINSIFRENKAITHPFSPGTISVQEIVGDIDGVHLRILDTPGLKNSPSERSYNLKILSNIKRFIRKHTPDVVLYVDRLDTYTRDHNDRQLLGLVSSSLGSSLWRKCIISLTHAGSNDHDPFGEFVLARCRFIQEQIVSHGGCGWGSSNPVWLVENHMGYKRDTNWRNRLFANDDEYGHNHITPFEPMFELGIVEKWIKKACFEGDGYRLKLFGTKHWFLACRLYS